MVLHKFLLLGNKSYRCGVYSLRAENRMEYFINSDLSVAVRLSELFGLDTVSQRKEHLLSYIHELEREY